MTDGPPDGTVYVVVSVVAVVGTVAIALAVMEWVQWPPRYWRARREGRRMAQDRVSDPQAPEQDLVFAPTASTAPAGSARSVIAALPAGMAADPGRHRQPGREQPVHDASGLEPPTIGGILEIGRRPWLLPLEPAQPAIAADAAVLGDLTVRAASIVGPFHRCEEPAKARQDAYRLGRDRRGRYLIIAVSDGMSDSARADLGATIAVTETVALIKERLDAGVHPTELPTAEIFAGTAKIMASTARHRHISPDDVRATLVAAVVPADPDPDGSRPLWFAFVGDSTLWVLHGSSWRCVAGSLKAADERGLSRFLPHTPREVREDVIRLGPECVIAVVTDGVGDALGLLDEGRWFADRWRTPPPIASFLLDVSYEARGFHDDRTAVVAWCPPGPGST